MSLLLNCTLEQNSGMSGIMRPIIAWVARLIKFVLVLVTGFVLGK